MRRYKHFFLAMILASLCAAVFAGGAPDEGKETDTQFAQWTLAVTALDTSALPSSRHIIGGILLRSLIESLRETECRIRSFGEMEYYQEIASSRAQGEAARALASKQNERDMLVFRGDPEWKYSRNLRNIENDILKLEGNFLAIQAKTPYITPAPVIKIQDDSNSAWPAPPRNGDEYVFCTGKKADAFLAGKVTEYYGRIYLTLKLYTLYTRSFSWESSILFSSEEIDNAVAEISSKLVAAVSGIEPARMAISVNPPDAIILVDDNWAGRGEVPVRELAPGNVVVASYADRHVPVSYPLEIHAGEITELQFNLTPLSLSSFTVDVPGSPDSSVFLGSLFVGKTPLTLELPMDQLSFISVETPSGETGTTVYRSNAPVRGSADFVTETGVAGSVTLRTSVPVSPNEKRVSTARNKFYSAYGRFWIALPASLVAIGVANNHINAYRYMPSADLRKSERIGTYVKIGAFVVIGLAATETVYRIVRYLVTSGANADPIARFDKTTPEGQ